MNHEPNAAIYGVATAIALAKLKTATEELPLDLPSALSDIKQFRSAAAGTRLFLGDFTQLLIGTAHRSAWKSAGRARARSNGCKSRYGRICALTSRSRTRMRSSS